MPVETQAKLVHPDDADLDKFVRLDEAAFTEALDMNGVGLPGYNDLSMHQKMFGKHSYFKIVVGDEMVGGIIVQDYGEGDYFLDAGSDPNFALVKYEKVISG